jgi:predicted RNA-binding protein with TRAM domain
MQGKPVNKNAPVSVGEELDVVIDDVGGRGDGIAKIDGFVIFVPNTKKSDAVHIKITKVLRNVGFGEVISEIKSVQKEEPKDTEDFGEDLEG